MNILKKTLIYNILSKKKEGEKNRIYKSKIKYKTHIYTNKKWRSNSKSTQKNVK